MAAADRQASMALTPDQASAIAPLNDLTLALRGCRGGDDRTALERAVLAALAEPLGLFEAAAGLPILRELPATLACVPDWMAFDFHMPPVRLRLALDDGCERFPFKVRWWDVRADRTRTHLALTASHPDCPCMALAVALLRAACHQMTSRPLKPREGETLDDDARWREWAFF